MNRQRRALENLAEAEDALSRRQSARFSSLGDALEWYFEYRARLQSAQTIKLNTEMTPGGQAILVSGGYHAADLDGALAELVSIHKILINLKNQAHQECQALELSWTGGPGGRPLTQERVADQLGKSQSQISILIGRAEFYLKLRLREEGIIT